MQTLTHDQLKSFLAAHDGPRISVYQKTHRTHPDNAQDAIRFRNQLRQLEEAFPTDTTGKHKEALLAPLNELAEDAEFWRHTLDGLAVLRSADALHVFRLKRPVPDLAIVSDTWHVKPLLRHIQTADEFQVLCLNRQEVHLYQGNRNGLEPVEMATAVPRTVTEALGDQFTDPYLKVSSYGLGPAGGSGRAMHHGHGDKSDEVELDILRFFRIVDRAILEHHSERSGLPLILAALPEYQGVFRELSNNRFLLPQGMDVDPGSLDKEQLRQRAWKIMEPRFHEKTREIIGRYQAQHGTGLASDDLQKTLDAALSGRVSMLLVDADRHIPGRVNAEGRTIELAGNADTGVEDVLDDIAEIVLQNGGETMVIPSEIMPSKTGLAALYRY